MQKNIDYLTQEELIKIKERGEALAHVRVFCSGKYGSGGEYLAIVKPAFFKNGNIKRTHFEVVKEITVIKKWYRYQTAREFHTLYSVDV